MTKDEIFHAVKNEREYQNGKWGTVFDDKNTVNDWIAYVVSYLGKAVTMPWNKEKFVAAIIKVTALCFAILERESYPPRHYD